ncbi:MAG: DUF1592 domain-containing protein [Myxococcota bacterium]
MESQRILVVSGRSIGVPLLPPFRLSLSLVLLLAGACTGEIEDVESERIGATPREPNQGSVVDFTCVESAPVELPLRRLSKLQHQNSVASVLSRFYDGNTVDAISSSLTDAIDRLPPDAIGTEGITEAGQRLFSRGDQAITEDGVRQSLNLAEAIGEELTSNDSRIEAWAGACATDGDPQNDGACLDAAITALGQLTHRRPLTAEEQTFYRTEVYIDGNVIERRGLAELVTVMFAQPSFVLHVEGGDGQLTGYELASRLSYHFWNDMPDDALFAAASDGSLLTQEGFQAEARRVASDPRADSAFREFLSEWFRFDQVRPLSQSEGGPAFEALRGDLAVDPSLDRAIFDEVVELFSYLVRNGGTFQDFFLSDLTLNTHPELAALYGMEPASPGMPATVPSERSGILTRAGMLLPRSEQGNPPGAAARTHPILRGVFVRRQILCTPIPDAPADALDDLPEVDTSTVSSRQEAEVQTGSGTCAGCHVLLNAPAFALEGFDSFGRFREEERLFDEDENEVGVVPVDTVVTLPDIDGDINGGADLARALYESEYVSSCFVRHYVRFSAGRAEDVNGADSCLLEALDEAVDADRPLVEVLAEVVLAPGFQVRNVQ